MILFDVAYSFIVDIHIYIYCIYRMDCNSCWYLNYMYRSLLISSDTCYTFIYSQYIYICIYVSIHIIIIAITYVFLLYLKIILLLIFSLSIHFLLLSSLSLSYYYHMINSLWFLHVWVYILEARCQLCHVEPSWGSSPLRGAFMQWAGG